LSTTYGSHDPFGYIYQGDTGRVQGVHYKIPQAEATAGIMLKQEDCPESPDPAAPVQQKMYRSFVAKLQFLALWVSCDIAFTASGLALFCASAGP
jgi:hypothetical protein